MMLSKENTVILDFEGFIDKPPSLVGIWHNGIFKTVVFDEDLSGVTVFPDVELANISSCLKEIMKFCVEHNCKIVGYSERELNVFADYNLDITELYFDARKELKRWYFERKLPNRPKPFALKSVLIHMGYPDYQSFGNRQTTQRIASVKIQLINKNQDYSALTPTVKGKWTKVLKYNKQDVIGLLWALENANLITK